MKRILISISLIALVAGCKVFAVAKKPKTDHFTVEGKMVLMDKKPFAELQAITYSLDGGEMVREMNFKLFRNGDQADVEGLIYFLHERNKDEEIEVEFDINEGSEIIKL
jgi:hypothetical protein